MFKFRGFYYAPEGAGSGGNAGTPPPPAAGTEAAGPNGSSTENAGANGGASSGSGDGTSNAGAGSPGSGSGDASSSKVEFTPAQQAVFNAEMKKAEARGLKKAKEDADSARLVEEGKFKELHTALEARVKSELEPAAAQVTVLAARFNASIDAEVKGWPDSVKKTDPGAADITKRMEWVDSHRDLAADIAKTKAAPEQEHGGGVAAPSGKQGARTATGILGGKYRTPGAQK